MSTTPPSLVWFRDDLRTGDHPALSAAVARGAPVAGVYVLADGDVGVRPLGAAARWKLHGALTALAADLDRLGIPLILRRGPAASVLRSMATDLGAGAVYWSRRYEPAAVAADAAIMAALKSDGLTVESANGALLVEPFRLKTKGAGFYKVFTPFCRAARALGRPLEPLPAPGQAAAWPTPPDPGDRLADWALTPSKPDWASGLKATWEHGEAAAKRRLAQFLDNGFRGYKQGRDTPAAPHTSALSPYLRFGEISPRQARHAAAMAADRSGGALDADFETFERELYWRDFSYNLLFHADGLASRNFQPRFDAFPWSDDAGALTAWRSGQTGYPIVDAGMRQLWRTGWMHNRIRMVTASFLTKHLIQDWRAGEAWFWDTLVDADIASNPANWQWVAGSGADAAPYFRIFNPMTQAQKFDAEGDYIRIWVPELAELPNKHLAAPWAAPAAVLAKAGVRLGETYPAPIVEHSAARARALAAFAATKV